MVTMSLVFYDYMLCTLLNALLLSYLRWERSMLHAVRLYYWPSRVLVKNIGCAVTYYTVKSREWSICHAYLPVHLTEILIHRLSRVYLLPTNRFIILR